MSKFALSAMTTAACLCAAAPGLAAPIYQVDSWPGDIDTIPCSAWQKAGDGTWVLTGTIKIGASEITNVGVKGDAAARKVERKCGK
jgi:hypothetical protein